MRPGVITRGCPALDGEIVLQRPCCIGAETLPN